MFSKRHVLQTCINEGLFGRELSMTHTKKHIRLSPAFVKITSLVSSSICKKTSWRGCPKWQILDSSKLRVFADDSFTFDEDGRKFFKRVKNKVGEGEIAAFPAVFIKRLQTQKKQGHVCERVKCLVYNPDIFQAWERKLLKTLREREKMLVTRISHSCHNISTML